MKKRQWTLLPCFIIFAVIMLIMSFISLKYSFWLFCSELLITLSSALVVLIWSLRFRHYIKKTVKNTAENIIGINSEFLEKYKYPIAVAGLNGDIVWCNSNFRRALCNGKNPESESMSAYISGFDVNSTKEFDEKDVAIDGKEFTVYCVSIEDGVICHFIENTYYKVMLREYKATLPCVAIITFDNAEDFSNDSDEAFSEVTITVEAALQKWATEYNSLYKKIGTNRYMIVFRECDVEKLVATKFPILKEIRSININQHVATISVGLCRGVKSIKDSELNARKALEMALGRGGDQVAIIKDNSYEFFGGTAAATEKVSKVRMRVIANAISRAVADCDKILIMGHRYSDLDCVGAAVGLQCIMEKSFKRYCKVVINKETSMAKQLVSYIEERVDTDVFISPDEAIRVITPRTLLIVVDTHIKNSLENTEIYDKCRRVIVIDHHRKAVNYIDNALVFCHEPSASSASEMCSEIISCLDDNALGYVQADALLSGIMLDTKNFVLKTGVRTFEAAAYLRKKGANTLTVKEMFSGSIETYREKVDIVCRSNVYRGCAISYSNQINNDVRLAAAQAADEMLTLKGISASFVIFEDKSKVNISARSYGRMNVQIIMEELGGGGHQTMAAAQLENTTKNEAHRLLVSVIDKILDDADSN